MTAALSVILVRTATGARASLQHVAEMADETYDATEIRRNMLVMGDSMRGFLLDPTQQAEWDAKMAADEALAKKVEELLAQTNDATRHQLAEAIGDFDETKLNPSENRVLALAKTDRAKAATLYFSEYFPLRQEQSQRVSSLIESV